MYTRSGSSAWLERLPVTQEVTGSSPVQTAIFLLFISLKDIIICGNENCFNLGSRIAKSLNTCFLSYRFCLDNSKHYCFKFHQNLKSDILVVLNNINVNDQFLELMLVKQFNRCTNTYVLLPCLEYYYIYNFPEKNNVKCNLYNLNNVLKSCHLIILNPYQKDIYHNKYLTFDTYHAFVYHINLIKKKLDEVCFLFIDNSDFSHFISNKYCYENLFYIDNFDYSKLSKNLIIIGNCYNNKLNNDILSKFNSYDIYIFFINIYDSFEFLKYNCVKKLYISNYIDYTHICNLYLKNKIYKIDITQYISDFVKTL